MDYFGLIKKAFKLTIKNRFLWIFGLFVGSAATFGGFGNYFNYKNPGQVDQVDTLALQRQIELWMHQHILLILTLILVLILLMICCFIFSIFAEGALISGVKKLENGEKMSFAKSLKLGSKHFWRIWGLQIIYSLITLVALFVLGIPVIAFISDKLYILAIGWGIVSMIIFGLLIMIIIVTKPYALRILVLENKKIIHSLREAIHLVRINLPEVILVYISLIVTSFAYSLTLLFALILVGALLIMLGIGLWFISQIAAFIFIVACGVAIFVTLLALGAAYNAFQSVTLTLAYEELKKHTL